MLFVALLVVLLIVLLIVPLTVLLIVLLKLLSNRQFPEFETQSCLKLRNGKIFIRQIIIRQFNNGSLGSTFENSFFIIELTSFFQDGDLQNVNKAS